LTLPYQKGPSGPWRLVNLESFGYSTLVPAPPTALFYQDLRFSGIPAAGDGQSYTYGLAATQDGSRVAVGMGGPGDGWGTTVGLPDGGEGFAMRGSFGQDRPMSVGLETVGSRTVAYSWSFGLVQATDVTNLPSDLTQHNLLAEIAPWPGGYLGKVAGTYLTYLNGSGGIIVVNAANLGPVGTITTAMPWTTIGAADFAGRVPQYYTAASFGGVLYILAELRPLAGEQSPSYGILSVTGLAKTASTIWRVPAVPGETWGYGGVSAALVQSGGVVYAIMPAVRSTPTLALVLYAARAASIGTHVGAFTIPQALYAQGFSGFGMVSAAAPPYLYVPTGPGAWAIPLSCVGVP
jgi:hypothetical protein